MRCVHLLAAHAQLNPIAVAITVVVVIVCCGAAPAGHVCGCSLLLLLLVPPAPKQSETTIKLIYVSGQICAAILWLIWQSAVCRFVARSDFPQWERQRGRGHVWERERSRWQFLAHCPVASSRVHSEGGDSFQRVSFVRCAPKGLRPVNVPTRQTAPAPFRPTQATWPADTQFGAHFVYIIK